MDEISIDTTPEGRLKMQIFTESKIDGGNPSHLLELLADAVEKRIWEKDNLTFRQFVETPYPNGIGMSTKDIQSIMSLQHRYERPDSLVQEIADKMRNLRRAVTDLIAGELETSGGDHCSEEFRKQNDNIILLSEQGTSSTYGLRRLKRDRPDLASQVLDNELSVNKAMIQAGFRDKTVTIYPENLEKTARVLRKHFGREQIEQLFDMVLEIQE